MQTTTITVEGDGITASLLAWRFLKRKPEGYVEMMLDLNPELAGLGPVIPVGTRVIMPLEMPVTDSKQTVIRLWD